jgi:hypothetical protein
MIQIKYILDEEAIDGEGRDEDLIHPRDLRTCPPKPSFLVRERDVGPQ